MLSIHTCGGVVVFESRVNFKSLSAAGYVRRVI